MRNSSPDTCCVRLSSQKKPTEATMLPHSRTAAAMPRKPAVIRRRSEQPYTHKHRAVSNEVNEETQSVAVVTVPPCRYITLSWCVFMATGNKQQDTTNH